MVYSRSVSARCPCFSQAFPRAHARPTRARPLAHRHNITHSNLHAHIHMHNCDALARARALARTFARVPCSRCMPTRKPCAYAPSHTGAARKLRWGERGGGVKLTRGKCVVCGEASLGAAGAHAGARTTRGGADKGKQQEQGCAACGDAALLDVDSWALLASPTPPLPPLHVTA